MALELDERQRAMLLEMGVRVWLPEMAAVPSVVVLQNGMVPVDVPVRTAPATTPVVAPVAAKPRPTAPQAGSSAFQTASRSESQTPAR